MEFSDFGWVSTVQDKIHGGLPNCDECDNVIQASRHCNSGISFTFYWCYQIIWLFPGAPWNSEDDTVIEKHGTKALYSRVKSAMHAIQTEDNKAQRDAAHSMIHIAKPWMLRK